ncbi:MAG: hypothetical protein P8M17_12275 [Saprospiraceae bacterium]|nr:hypothetical protein [Saprospiraceae bacterium]
MPVVKPGAVFSIIRKLYLLVFRKSLSGHTLEKIINITRLNKYNAETIMTRSGEKLKSTNRINVA